ncbi:MAG: hypothetical protein ABIH83_01600 [Candidatus Micrarchaeota archaeon]
MKYQTHADQKINWKDTNSTPFSITKKKLLEIENKIRLDFNLFETERGYTISKTPEFGVLFSFYTNTTNEKDIQLRTYKKEIFPKLKNRRKIICIGPGDGPYIEKFLANAKFEKAFLIERNGGIAQSLENRLKNSKIIKGTKFEISGEAFPNCKLEKADMITMDHVHYFFPPDDWVSLSKEAYSATKKDGIFSAIIHGDRQYGYSNEVATIIEHFGGKNDDITSFAYDLQMQLADANMAFLCSRTDHSSATYEAIRYIMNFFMLDSQAKVEEKTFREYMEENTYNTKKEIYNVIKADRYIIAQKSV